MLRAKLADCTLPAQEGLDLLLEDALALFRRLGVDVQSISTEEFTASYFALAKRYHPDRGNQKTQS